VARTKHHQDKATKLSARFPGCPTPPVRKKSKDRRGDQPRNEDRKGAYDVSHADGSIYVPSARQPPPVGGSSALTVHCARHTGDVGLEKRGGGVRNCGARV
jgi:hypothetical protein